MTNPLKSCPGCADREIRQTLTIDKMCSPCRKKERNRLWREQNPGVLAANAKAWRAAGNKAQRSSESLERQKVAQRTKYAENAEFRERAKRYAAEQRARDPEKARADVKRWVEENRVGYRVYQRNYTRIRRAEDEGYRQRCLDAQSLWRMRKWAKDPASDTWVHHRENQEVGQDWRRSMQAWQQGHCYICNQKSDRLTIEHLIPRSRGGPTVKQNLVLTCENCNYSRQHRFLGQEWSPDFVEPCANYLISKEYIVERIREAGIDCRLNAAGGYTLSSEFRVDRQFFIGSTFFGSDRNPGSNGGRALLDLPNDVTDIVLFDREWFARPEAVLNMLRSKMGVAERGLGARQLNLAEVPSFAACEFLMEHHVMGPVNGPFRIALVDGDRIHGLGVFADRGDTYECVRLAFRGHVAGGMSRIITELFRRYGKRPVWSYVDSRYALGDGHEAIGFTYHGETKGTYQWVLPDRMQHQRYLSNDNKMSRSLLVFDPVQSRESNIRMNGIYKIWMPPRHRMVLE